MTGIADVEKGSRGLVALAVEAQVATITMDDPARRNVLSKAMLSGLMDAFEAVRRAAARTVILRAAPRNTVWCAGFDIRDLAPGFDPLAQDGALQAMFHAIQDFPAPVIAMLTGTAWGGGTDLALRCDIVIAAPAVSRWPLPQRVLACPMILMAC